MGSIPSADDLASTIRETPYNPAELRMFAGLFAGDDDGGEESDGLDELDDFKIFGVIGCNSFGEEFLDFPTCLARGVQHSRPGTNSSSCSSTSREGGTSGGHDGGTRLAESNTHPPSDEKQVGHLGLFPSFSMLNHSCLPNAVNFVVAERMMVFAARSIPKGSEVLINYLGRASLRPVDERQSQLAEGYHFSCDCPRCRVELLCSCMDAGSVANGSNLLKDVRDILGRCDERASDLSQLDPPHGSGSSEAVLANSATLVLEGLLAKVRNDADALEEVAQGHAVGPTVAPVDAPQQWLQASAFDLYSQHVECAEALGRRDEAVAALERQVGVCEVAAPCSDLHMYLAVKLLSLEQGASGADSERARGALRRCTRVLRGRYGAELSDATVEMLMQGAAYGLSQVVV